MIDLKGKEVVAKYREDETHVYFGEVIDVVQMSESVFGFIIDVGFRAYVTVTSVDYDVSTF